VFQAVEGRVQRPLIHFEHTFRSLLDTLSDIPTVQRAISQSSKDQQSQSSLQKFQTAQLRHDVAFLHQRGVDGQQQ
jgi:hypothetical protein